MHLSIFSPLHSGSSPPPAMSQNPEQCQKKKKKKSKISKSRITHEWQLSTRGTMDQV